MVPVAFEGSAITRFPTRTSWDAESTDIVASVIDRWGLEVVGVLPGGFAGSVLDVIDATGSRAVLKVGYPHDEAIGEAVALAAWAPDLAPVVLKQDAWAWSMLLERVYPGLPLGGGLEWADDDLESASRLLRRLHAVTPPPGIPALEDLAAGWVDAGRRRLEMTGGRLADRGSIDLARAAIDDFGRLARDRTQGSLLHGDFNPGNILRSADGWVAIDPKPMVGDAAYDAWPLVAQFADPFTRPDPQGALRRQLTLVATEADLDPGRALRWCAARTGLVVSWYLDAGRLDLARESAAELRVWASLIECGTHAISAPA